MKKLAALLPICLLCIAVSIQAQAPQGPPKPGPEIKKLAYNLGTWHVSGEVKPFAGMPGGKLSSTEKCEWYSGGFFVTCHAEGTGPMGPEKATSFMGYDPLQKVYTYHEFSNTGDAIDAKGTVDGETWNWTAESKMGDDKYNVRVTIKHVSATEYTFKLEMAKNGGEFTVLQELTGRKAAAAAPAKKS
ncbi:MAG TPA: DUF1579 family protein [Candidatus Acidoferrum sp.]|jgi:hypothetical protein